MNLLTPRIRFACQTYAWQMSGETYRGRLDHIAAVAAQAGFAGLEPEVVMLDARRSPADTARVLSERGLELAALAYAALWHDSVETDAERADADAVIEFLGCFPGTKLVLVQLPGSDRRDLGERQDHAIACLNAVGRRAHEAGLEPTVHPNSPPGSVFRMEADYERLLTGLDDRIGFAPDVGHIAAGAMQPLDVLRRYRERVDHVHFKDIGQDGGWAPTGEGRLDFDEIVAFLRDTGYAGWIVFEDESPSSERDPDRASANNGVYVRDRLAPLLSQSIDDPRVESNGDA